MSNVIHLHPESLPRIAETLKSLGHPCRLRILECLAQGETSVGALAERLAVAQATISQHLKIMRASHVVQCRRHGIHACYSLAHPGLRQLLSCLTMYQDHCRPSPSHPFSDGGGEKKYTSGDQT